MNILFGILSQSNKQFFDSERLLLWHNFKFSIEISNIIGKFKEKYKNL